MAALLFFIGFGLSLLGSYLFAYTIFKKLWKAETTHPKLIGFLLIFSTSVTILTLINGWIIISSFNFGR